MDVPEVTQLESGERRLRLGDAKGLTLRCTANSV